MIDFHVHSTFSDGEKDVRTIIDLAVQRGITDLAITDHFDPFDEALSNRDKGLEALLECDIIITSPHYVEGVYPFEKGEYNLDIYCG